MDVSIQDAQTIIERLKLLPRRTKPKELIDRLERALIDAQGVYVTCGQCGYEGITHTNVCPECSARVR